MSRALHNCVFRAGHAEAGAGFRVGRRGGGSTGFVSASVHMLTPDVTAIAASEWSGRRTVLRDRPQSPPSSAGRQYRLSDVTSVWCNGAELSSAVVVVFQTKHMPTLALVDEPFLREWQANRQQDAA